MARGGHVVALILEGAGHVVAEVAAELGRKETQQSPEEAVAARRIQIRRKSGFRRAMAIVCSSRATRFI